MIFSRKCPRYSRYFSALEGGDVIMSLEGVPIHPFFEYFDCRGIFA
jgi:hypothetical protein